MRQSTLDYTTKNSKRTLSATETTENSNHKTLAKLVSAHKNQRDSLHFYDQNNIDQLAWPPSEEAQYACRYFIPMIRNGIDRYIDNIDASLSLIVLDDQVIPILHVNESLQNSYVCSPYSNYISLALERLSFIKNKMLKKTSENALNLLGTLLKKGKINKVIYINHWLLSTDLHPNNLSQEQVAKVTLFLQKKFPKHAIIMRSLNHTTTPSLRQHLKQCGFKFIASRQIYLTDTNSEELFKTRIIKSDMKMWREKDYEVIDGLEMQDTEYQRVLELYKSLAIDHHTSLNPQLNVRFIKCMVEQKILQIKAIKKDGIIHGAVGYMERNHTFLCPFFGYDKNHPDQTKLYRLLSTLLLLEAFKNKKLFHQSAGASFYKTIRRAKPHLEYIGVCSVHLSYKRRLIWNLIRTLMNVAGVPFLKRY